MVKPGGKSIVWEHFGLEGEKWTTGGHRHSYLLILPPMCSHQKQLAGPSKDSPCCALVKQANAPRRLLKSHTPAPLPVGQATIQESLKYDPNSISWKDITNVITYCICKDSHATYIWLKNQVFKG